MNVCVRQTEIVDVIKFLIIVCSTQAMYTGPCNTYRCVPARLYTITYRYRRQLRNPTTDRECNEQPLNLTVGRCVCVCDKLKMLNKTYGQCQGLKHKVNNNGASYNVCIYIIYKYIIIKIIIIVIFEI